MAPHTYLPYTYIIELPLLVGVCVMTFLHISNRWVVKRKIHISPLDGASYQKVLLAYNIEPPQLVGVYVMTFLDISNRLAVKHKKNTFRR